MNAEAETHHVRLGTKRQLVRLSRSRRKTVGIAVNPDASVSVTAPFDAPLDRVLSAVEMRAAWILASIRGFERYLPHTPPRRYVAGETHLYLGREYRLAFDPEVRGVQRTRDRIVVGTQSMAPAPEAVRSALRRWYGAQARTVLNARLDIGTELFRAENVQRPTLTIRRLDKRWGSMSHDGRRMLLNTRLVEADRDEIDYVVAHELAHIVEPHHRAPFYNLLARKMPDWRSRKEGLERRFA